MCRFVSYLGTGKMLINRLLEQPTNSLIKQSKNAKKDAYSINADGFGIAWYNHEIDDKPGVFKSTQPAWNDNNLQYLAQKVTSGCFLAHVRASNVGDVSLNNCHPFTYKNYSFAHNGIIRNFNDIKIALINKLDRELFYEINGQTDSEHLFFLIMHFLESESLGLEDAVIKAFSWIIMQQRNQNADSFSKLNIVISDGKKILATKFSSKGNESLSLNYCVDEPELFKNIAAASDGIIIASEALTEISASWKNVPHNSYIIFDTTNKGAIVKPFPDMD